MWLILGLLGTWSNLAHSDHESRPSSLGLRSTKITESPRKNILLMNRSWLKNSLMVKKWCFLCHDMISVLTEHSTIYLVIWLITLWLTTEQNHRQNLKQCTPSFVIEHISQTVHQPYQLTSQQENPWKSEWHDIFCFFYLYIFYI